MKINPSTMSWIAPTTNVDDTPIDYALEYEVGLQGINGVIEPLMTVPAQLQDDDTYTAPIADLGLDEGDHFIALRTFEKSNPERMSAWSDVVGFTIMRIPNAPLGLAVS